MENMYTLKQVAEILSVAVITLRKWISEGKMEAVKINGTVRVKESEIIRLQSGSK